MRIRTRYTLMTAGLIGLVVAAIAVTVTRAQRGVLQAQSRERLEALTEGVARLAQESLDTRDQLMLISYLMFLQKEHPELGFAAVTRRGHTWTLGKDAPGSLCLARVVQAKHPVRYTVTALPSNGASSDLAVSTSGVTLSVTGNALVKVEEAQADALSFKLGFAMKWLDDEVARQLDPMVRQTAAIAGLFMLLGMMGAMSLGKILTGPVMALTAAVVQVKDGNYDVTVPVRGKDEVGALALSFNEMTGRIKDLVRSREDLLHTLTHELNTPLSGLKGYLELWQDRKISAEGPERREALETMTAAVMRMEQSLESALRLFSAEAGRLQTRKSVVWLDDLFREVSTLFAPVARSKNVAIALPPPTPGAFLNSDEELLRQVVTNLVSNALKYTPDGGAVRLGVAIEGESLRFSVSDTGFGIPEADLPHLFTKFYRSVQGPEGRRRIPGTGLGLNIVGKAVKALGGSVSVQSAPGKGSTFTVMIPRGPLPRQEAA